MKGGRAGVEAGNDGRALQSLRLYWTGPQTVEAVSTGERRHARSFSPRTRKWKSRSGGVFLYVTTVVFSGGSRTCGAAEVMEGEEKICRRVQYEVGWL
jgi:hypothetical protein